MKEKDLIAAWERLDRSRFLPGPVRSYAEYDGPLSIGWGQTISQPTLVLEMTRILHPDDTSIVLEIGTGSGYQTALLSGFCAKIHTVERIPELSHTASERLSSLGYSNIAYHVGDGSEGWPDAQPYDRIMVTAAAGDMPDPLVRQLAPGGRMVIPVGPPYNQELMVVEKDRHGLVREKSVLKVSFVELVGSYGWKRGR